MRRTRHTSKILYILTTVACLLFLPVTSSAGGFGDLFLGAIVDKIKSIPIEEILQPSEKDQETVDPALTPSQDNSHPAATTVETKKGKPTETPTSPVIAADSAIVKEAEEVKAWCQKNPKIKTNNNCECVTNQFIAERQADPVAGKDTLLSQILTVNKCPNLEGIRANGYKECIGSSDRTGFNTNGNEVETYCQCVGKRTAKNVSEHKGKLGPKQRSNYRYYAIMYCRKAEAYR